MQKKKFNYSVNLVYHQISKQSQKRQGEKNFHKDSLTEFPYCLFLIDRATVIKNDELQI